MADVDETCSAIQNFVDDLHTVSEHLGRQTETLVAMGRAFLTDVTDVTATGPRRSLPLPLLAFSRTVVAAGRDLLDDVSRRALAIGARRVDVCQLHQELDTVRRLRATSTTSAVARAVKAIDDGPLTEVHDGAFTMSQLLLQLVWQLPFDDALATQLDVVKEDVLVVLRVSTLVLAALAALRLETERLYCWELTRPPPLLALTTSDDDEKNLTAHHVTACAECSSLQAPLEATSFTAWSAGLQPPTGP
jgi:hypothetical protein